MKKQFTNPTPIGSQLKKLRGKGKTGGLSKSIEPEQKKIEIKEQWAPLEEDLSQSYVLIDPKIAKQIQNIQKIIKKIDKHLSKDVRGGKFGGKIV